MILAAAVSERPARITLVPFEARVTAIPWPIPEVAPTTNAIFDMLEDEGG